MPLLNYALFRPIALLILGATCVLGFAPFYVYPVSLIAVAGFCLYLWQSTNIKAAARDGFLFGLGLYGFGIYWIYICLHDFGGMPGWMAGICTFLLSAFMAGFSAMMAATAYWLWHRSTLPIWLKLPLPIAVSWGLFDWIKSWIFTGFPWLGIGYTQAPSGTFSGFLPIIGVYGVSVITVLYASLIALFVREMLVLKTASRNTSKAIILSLVVLFIVGWSSKALNWTQPVGKPFSVALLQGNIAQDLKWSPDAAIATIKRYQSMVEASQADLIILPETALPILSSQWKDEYKQPLLDHAKSQDSNLIVGIVQDQPATRAYFNGAISIGADEAQSYQKSHLVPFGEFIPFKQWLGWIYRDYLNMPMSDMSRGSKQQRPMHLKDQKVAINICYEDVFGEEIIRQLPEATILANLTNDAWYGDSFAADQHMQFSQARALETGRMVLRATNTGATAVINPKGQVLAYAPHFTQTTLSSTAQGYQGATPYVRFGNWPFLLLSGLLIVFVKRRKNQ